MNFLRASWREFVAMVKGCVEMARDDPPGTIGATAILVVAVLAVAVSFALVLGCFT